MQINKFIVMSTLYLSSRKLWIIVVTTVLLITTFAVDTYYHYENSSTQELTWTKIAATEAEEVAAIYCSDHGRAYLDGIPTADGIPECECHTCYSGPTCGVYNQSCVADAKVGDALFLRKYWMIHKENIATLIPGWHRMSYYFIGGTFMSKELEKYIRTLHEKVGNAKVDGKHLVFGNGVTQLINGVVTSLSPNLTANPDATKKKVVAYVPYYPLFKKQTEMFNHHGYEWKGNASDYVHTANPEDFIELVTSPNNPDGFLRKSIIPRSLAVYDHATYWPQYSPIKNASDEDIMLFSLSKYTGHSGSRFGWAFIRDKAVYDRLNTYVATNTEGVSRETQFRTLKIIKEIVHQIDLNHDPEDDFNTFGHHVLRDRWTNITELLSKSNRFTVQKMSSENCTYFKGLRSPSPAYAWLKCEWVGDEDCATVLENGKILAYSGVIYEESSRYARLSLIKTEDDFEELMERLRDLVNVVEAKTSITRYNHTIAKERLSKHPFIYDGDH